MSDPRPAPRELHSWSAIRLQLSEASTEDLEAGPCIEYPDSGNALFEPESEDMLEEAEAPEGARAGIHEDDHLAGSESEAPTRDSPIDREQQQPPPEISFAISHASQATCFPPQMIPMILREALRRRRPLHQRPCRLHLALMIL